MLLQPVTAADLLIHPVAERHNYVRELAFRPLVLRIRRPANVLRLVAVLACHIPLDPVPLLPLPRLEGLVLGADPVESPGALTWRVIKPAAKDAAVEAAA